VKKVYSIVFLTTFLLTATSVANPPVDTPGRPDTKPGNYAENIKALQAKYKADEAKLNAEHKSRAQQMKDQIVLQFDNLPADLKEQIGQAQKNRENIHQQVASMRKNGASEEEIEKFVETEVSAINQSMKNNLQQALANHQVDVEARLAVVKDMAEKRREIVKNKRDEIKSLLEQKQAEMGTE